MIVNGFFAGVGGIEEAFKQAGFKINWASEIDENASKTYRKNHENTLYVGDIHNLESEDIPNSDVIVAGFPCQAFSIAGYRKGFEDERGNVFFKLARIIKDKMPKAILLENVKNLLTHDNGNTYRTIRETLENYGYYVKHMVLNASNYGNLPQNRERIYIVGFLNEIQFRAFDEPLPIELKKTINDIIDYEKKVDESYYYREGKYKMATEIISKVTDKNTFYQLRRVYVRENKSNLCPTLTANMGGGGHNVPLILTKYGVRKLTPKECFRFQGYDNIKLPTNIAISQLYKQAGNSVAIPVVRRIAENMKIALEK